MKIAVIPARGGSKRIPRKNIRDFAGKPMIAHSIICAQQSGLFDRIIVSTDDDEIAALAKTWGAEAPFKRPAELANDFAPTVPVIAHAIEWLKANDQYPDYVCCIYATAPFMLASDLEKAYRLLTKSDASYAFAVTSFAFPIQRAIRLNDSASVEAFYPQFRDTRSQDLEEAWHDAGQFYWGKSCAFLENQPVFAPHSKAVILPRHRVQDIDTEEDWQRAELMYRVQQELSLTT